MGAQRPPPRSRTSSWYMAPGGRLGLAPDLESSGRGFQRALVQKSLTSIAVTSPRPTASSTAWTPHHPRRPLLWRAVITKPAIIPISVGLVYVEASSRRGRVAVRAHPAGSEPSPPFDFARTASCSSTRPPYVPASPMPCPGRRRFMRDSQVPISFEGCQHAADRGGLRDKPSWYQLALGDHVIPPEAQRLMSNRAGSPRGRSRRRHLAFIAQARPRPT